MRTQDIFKQKKTLYRIDQILGKSLIEFLIIKFWRKKRAFYDQHYFLKNKM